MLLSACHAVVSTTIEVTCKENDQISRKQVTSLGTSGTLTAHYYVTYSYDALNQLTGTTTYNGVYGSTESHFTIATETFAYDALGNRTNLNAAGTANIDIMNQYIADANSHKARGVDVDQWTVTLDEATHSALHYGGGPKTGGGWWNERIMQTLMNQEAKIGRKLTATEIEDIGRQMMKLGGIEQYSIHPYGK
jgi:hypothetical protein